MGDDKALLQLAESDSCPASALVNSHIEEEPVA